MDCLENGIIFGTAMAEKRLENGKVRYSAACPMGREHFVFKHLSLGCKPLDVREP